MSQKLDSSEDIDKEILKALLLKDGEVYQHSGGDKVLSDEDIETLCDRYDYTLFQFMWKPTDILQE